MATCSASQQSFAEGIWLAISREIIDPSVVSIKPEEPSIEARLQERERPAHPLVMYQRWSELLFLHWSFDPEVVQSTLPAGLWVDTYEDKAWIGVVPFVMEGVRPRFLPPVGGLSHFPELNLRTYVVDKFGRPGVWFYSLDTPQPLANWIARTLFKLNYRMAKIEAITVETTTDYRSQLALQSGWDEWQTFRWERIGEDFAARLNSLEFFLVERYRLFAYHPERKMILTGQVHHTPYRLQRVKLMNYSKRLFALSHLPTPNGEPFSALASVGVQVRVHAMERIRI